MSAAAIWALDPASYTPHALHGVERAFSQTNCYLDLWIEMLHTLDLEPVACLAVTLSTDFEGDQWTFLKPSFGDLAALYGTDVQELNVYRKLHEHVLEQVAQRRPVLAEVDAFYLPDTTGVSYGIEHTKTTIAVQSIDLGAQTLGYFHNSGYYTLAGVDFTGVFRLDRDDPAMLDPYVELVKLDRLERLPRGELVHRALGQARAHLARRPASNPVTRFARRFEADLVPMVGRNIAHFHKYAFATIRQLGASAELAAAFVRWLEHEAELDAGNAATAFDEVAASAKALIFKTARAVNAKKTIDPAPVMGTMAVGWEAALGALDAALQLRAPAGAAVR